MYHFLTKTKESNDSPAIDAIPRPAQTSIQAEMTAATALFMIPTALIFPALLRKANTPPSSATLSRATQPKHHNGHQWQGFEGNEYGISLHERILNAQNDDFDAALSAGETPRGPVCTWRCRKAPEKGHTLREESGLLCLRCCFVFPFSICSSSKSQAVCVSSARNRLRTGTRQMGRERVRYAG